MSDVLQFPARPAPARTDAAPVAIAAHDSLGRPRRVVALSLPMLLRQLPADLHPAAVAGAMVAAYFDTWEREFDANPKGDDDARHKAGHTALAWAWTDAKRAWRARLDALRLPYGLTARLEREWREEIRKHGIAAKARRRAELAKQAERAAEIVEMLETWG